MANWAHNERSQTSARRAAAQGPPATAQALDKPVQFVRGVGPYRAKILADMGIETVADLIEYFPFRHEVQPPPRAIDTLLLDEPATIIGVVDSVRSSGGGWGGRFGKPTLRVKISDGTGRAKITWFNASYLQDRITRGQVLRLYGKVGVDNDLAQLINPSVDWLDAEADPATWDYAKMVPVYRATEKLTSGQITRLVDEVLDDAVHAVADPLPETIRRQREYPSRAKAIFTMHRPRELEELNPARQRLAYEELFLMQMAILLQRRWAAKRAGAVAMPTIEKVDHRIRRRFPFTLTDAQNRVIEHIKSDMNRTTPMTRLLQGDVGSGKTVVALYAALVTVANRHQCAILAPTAVLADQHFKGIEKYLAHSRVRRCLLTGKTTKKDRDRLLREIAEGKMDLIVGTQALLERQVRFASLALVVVDEQHKFGVAQRATLKGAHSKKGADKKDSRVQKVPHYMVMTATPIPRTLSMTVFGDLDVSIIDQLPPGRQPIKTRVVTERTEAQAWLEVRRRIAEGDQIYIVYPLVEESEALDLKAATVEVDRVSHELLPGARVGLLHGRMKKDAKQSVMQTFASGKLDVLVSTTVIEVGVDVPNATVMVIQHAERYGLSALHQLRGRVGRGSKPSICLLMSDSQTEPARRRLNVLCKTTDGFRIAEEDLRLRGPGELLGTRQHGFPEFRVANLIEDADLLLQARDDAAQIVRDDPGLKSPSHSHLKAELRRRFRNKVAFMDVG